MYNFNKNVPLTHKISTPTTYKVDLINDNILGASIIAFFSVLDNKLHVLQHSELESAHSSGIELLNRERFGNELIKKSFVRKLN